jgi:hypothetical protein
MFDKLRCAFITACFYFVTLALVPLYCGAQSNTSDPQLAQPQSTPNPSAQQNSYGDPLAGNAAAQRTVTATKRWLAGTMSTSGMTAELREIARGTVKGKLEVQYHIFVTGAPKVQTYTLIDWPPNAPDPAPSIAGLSILQDGQVVCAGRATDQCSNPDKPEKKDTPIKLVFYPLDGEIYRLALVSQDQKAKIFFYAIPAPIQATDNGCTLEVISLRLKNQLVLIRAKGFQPNEPVIFQSKSEQQTSTPEAPDQADANGEYQLPMAPFTKGQDRGSTEIKLQGAKCAAALTFHWGN